MVRALPSATGAGDAAVRPSFRTAAAGTGSGLGLSLVAAVARLHSATIELGDNQPGLRVAVLFAPAGVDAGSRAGGSAGPRYR